MTRTPDAGFVRISEFEFAAGWVPGQGETAMLPRSARPDPLATLERIVLEALQRRPCVIGFSGGRDSSAILAVAVHVARREGLDLPVAATKVYPGVPTADESSWQELVVRWLGVDEWVRREYTDELDLLAPSAVASLRRHGPLWPATAHNRGPTIEIAKGGSYVDGEGGDDILGEMRITPLTQLLAGERPVDRSSLRAMARVFAPGVVRKAVAARHQRRSQDRAWLRPHVADWYTRSVLDDVARERLHYGRAVEQMATRRAAMVALRNLDAIGRSLDVTYLHPLCDPRFVAAVSAFGGRLGLTSRTAMMRALFTDLLPDEVNARADKATFNNAFIHRYSREFLETWDGTGLDPDIVDTDVLRELWHRPRVHGGTFQLIHAAWLASQPRGSVA